jgi:HD-like signal output (HDOD) protein
MMNKDKALKELSFRKYPVSLPAAKKISDICGKGYISAPQLFTLINTDPVSTAIIYGLYHEFFPSVQKEFFGVPHIITVLGVSTVKNFIFNAAKRTLAEGGPDGECLNRQKLFLRRSLATAAASRLLALECGVDSGGLPECYCAGLLYNIGHFIVSGYSGAEFNVEQGDVTALEAARLTAALWGFPTAVEAVYRQDYSVRAAACAALSDYLVGAQGTYCAEKKPEAAPRSLFKTLSLPEDIFERIRAPLAAETRKAQAFTGLEEE